MADIGRTTRHVMVAASLDGITLPDPNSGSSDRHLQDIQTPGALANSAVLFFRVQHSGDFALTVRVNDRHVLRGHALVDPSPSFFRFAIKGTLKATNEIVLSGTGRNSVTIRDVFIMYAVA